MDDAVINHWTANLNHLTRIELLGPFLVRIAGWINFFENLTSGLQGFLIAQSPRFDLDCMDALSTRCSESLTELRLAQIGKFNDSFLPHVATFTNLRTLELPNPGESLTDTEVIAMLKSIGPGLELIDLSGSDALTDVVLLIGLKEHTRILSSLRMSGVNLLTDAGVAGFFSTFMTRPALRSIDLSKNHLLASESLTALLEHSGSILEELNIHSWKDVSEESLKEVATMARSLVKVDFGFCRGVDNFIVKDILDNCSQLKELKCFGCNRLTVDCPKKVSDRAR